MEIILPHRVEYDVKEHVSIDDVIGTLRANQRLAMELGPFLESLFEGLTVEHTAIRVEDISTGSLREYFFLALIVAFQEDLKQEVPALLEKWFGLPVSTEYDSVVTVCLMVMLFYGADYIYRKVANKSGSQHLKAQMDILLAELAVATGQTEAKIRHGLLAQFEKPARRKELAKAAIQFFRPSRVQNNEPISVNGRLIESKTIAEVPYQIDVDDLEEGDRFHDLPGVRVQLHAKDKDRADIGWAGVVPTISDERARLHLYPEINPKDLWQREAVWADVKAVYRTGKNGKERLALIYIIRLCDSPDPKMSIS